MINPQNLTHPCIRWFGLCRYGDECIYVNYPRDTCLLHVKGKCQSTLITRERCKNGRHIAIPTPEEYHNTTTLHPCLFKGTFKGPARTCVFGSRCPFLLFPRHCCLSFLKGQCNTANCSTRHDVSSSDPRYQNPAALPQTQGAGEDSTMRGKRGRDGFEVAAGFPPPMREGEPLDLSALVAESGGQVLLAPADPNSCHPCLATPSGCESPERCPWSKYPREACLRFLKGECGHVFGPGDDHAPHFDRLDPRYLQRHPCNFQVVGCTQLTKQDLETLAAAGLTEEEFRANNGNSQRKSAPCLAGEFCPWLHFPAYCCLDFLKHQGRCVSHRAPKTSFCSKGCHVSAGASEFQNPKIHPCVRQYGSCNFGHTCEFAFFPRDACMFSIKKKGPGRCKGKAICAHLKHNFSGEAATGFYVNSRPRIAQPYNPPADSRPKGEKKATDKFAPPAGYSEPLPPQYGNPGQSHAQPPQQAQHQQFTGESVLVVAQRVQYLHQSGQADFVNKFVNWLAPGSEAELARQVDNAAVANAVEPLEVTAARAMSKTGELLPPTSKNVDL